MQLLAQNNNFKISLKFITYTLIFSGIYIGHFFELITVSNQLKILKNSGNSVLKPKCLTLFAYGNLTIKFDTLQRFWYHFLFSANKVYIS